MMKLELGLGLVQIATPYSVGTGFILAEEKLIVTNEQVVRDNRDVIVYGEGFKQQVVDVIFIDEQYDLAFLELPDKMNGKGLYLASDTLREGDTIHGFGYPYGFDFISKSGIVQDLNRVDHNIQFIDHDIALPIGFSGGPLVNEAGEVVGVNTFLDLGDRIDGFALPSSVLAQQIFLYKNSKERVGTYCSTCKKVVTKQSIRSKKFCKGCGASVVLPSYLSPYEPSGTSLRIEQLLKKLNYNPVLSRRGVNNWGIVKGSAHINISYYEKFGLIIGDSYLCKLPIIQRVDLYEFLLRQNNNLEGLTLSVKGEDIVLSLLIYDRNLNTKSGIKLFELLFQQADDLDNILVEKYGARWIKESPVVSQEKNIAVRK